MPPRRRTGSADTAGRSNIASCRNCSTRIEKATIPSNSPRPALITWVHSSTSNVWCQSALLDQGMSAAFADPR